MDAPSAADGRAQCEHAEAGAIVCWTRMHAEAGQELGRIVERKELERRAGQGTFFWGVGSAPPNAVPVLSRTGNTIPLLFSVMKSRPKPQDVAPERVLAWRCFVDHSGVVRPLPPHALVTSRATTRAYHYALVCCSDRPLALCDLGWFDPAAYRNIGGTGAVIGASQVTALLRKSGVSQAKSYAVAMSAFLCGDLWVKLVDPIELGAAERVEVRSVGLSDPSSWLEFVRRIRHSKSSAPCARDLDQPRLFVL